MITKTDRKMIAIQVIDVGEIFLTIIGWTAMMIGQLEIAMLAFLFAQFFSRLEIYMLKRCCN